MAIVRYLVHDIESAITFYTTHLDFKLVDQMGPAFAIVERDGLELWLSGPQTSASRPMPDGRQPLPGGWNRFVIEIDDIDSRVASMKMAGVQFRNDIIQGPGGKQILVDDPSGNPIELFQPAG
ncbi:MAG: VOC family protein [Anaerolineae bacterium]|nr:VOC family protein [Anaerolineae bacterium]